MKLKKKLAILAIPLLINGCATKSTKQYLQPHEVLHIYLKQPIETVSHIVVWPDEINWYEATNEWFILDYKSDPGTYYIDIKLVSMFGIES